MGRARPCRGRAARWRVTEGKRFDRMVEGSLGRLQTSPILCVHCRKPDAAQRDGQGITPRAKSPVHSMSRCGVRQDDLPKRCTQIASAEKRLSRIVSTARRSYERRIELSLADLRVNPDGI